LQLKYGDLITVVVPVFNRAHLITRSVGSLCSQTYRDLEILIVDDCSTDGIEDAVEVLEDPRVRLIRRSANGGAAAARNTGIKAAKGEWIAFHDSDDICVFDRIERQVRTFLELPPDHIGVHCSRFCYFETDETTHSRGATFLLPAPDFPGPLSGDLHPATIRGNFISVPTMLLRRDAILAAGLFDERLRNNEDWDFTIRLTAKGKFGYVPEPLYLTVLKLPKEKSADHISFNDRYSARSFVRITGKLRKSGISDLELASHYTSAARFLLRQGHPRLARRYLLRVLRAQPGAIRTCAMYVLSYFPRLYDRLRKN
jgi:glycosyltransferase involved in cell wall biosynthesis